MKAYRNVSLNLPGGMISLPVSIAKATGNNDLSAKVVGPDGGALRQVYLDGADKEVPAAQTQREIEGRVVSQDELKEINDSCKLTDLDIIEVAPLSAVDFRRVTGSYYIYANKKSGNPRALALFIEALKKLKCGAVVKWTPSSRQQLLFLYPDKDENTLVGVAVCFAADWRSPDEDVLSHASEKPQKQEVDLAVQILETVKTDGVALASEYDEAIQRKKDLIEGREVDDLPEAIPTASTDGDKLLKQLQASVEQTKVA
jgi:non-homologous end joining protein Ku